MKIAVYYNLSFSGAKRTVFEHVKGLKSLGHIVDVYTIDSNDDIFHPGRIADNLYFYKYKRKTINLPSIKRLMSDLSDFILLKSLHKKIAKDIDSRKYDIALIHTDKLTQAPFILRFLKTKKVYFCLEPLKIGYEYGLRISENLSFPKKTYEAWNRNIRKRIDRENARSSDDTFAISYFGRELMIQAFDLYPQISYLGVNINDFKPLNIRKKNQILYIGQKSFINGYNFAQEAVNLIPQQMRPELKILSISNNKKEHLPDDSVVRLYNESLITLSLSNYDTFGLVVLESLACEVPVIAFNVAGYRETMRDGKYGFLVEFNAKDIAEKITYLLNNRESIKKMGLAGRQWVENNWTWKKHIKILEEQLISIIAA